MALDTTFTVSGDHADYHAIIHSHENMVVWAADYGTNGVAIQDAIDAAAAASIGTVFISPGIWNVAATIICEQQVDVILDRQARLNLTANTDLIQMAPNMTLHGGRLTATGIVGHTGSVVLLTGAEFNFSQDLTIIENIEIYGRNNESAGNGILMQPDSDLNYVSGVRIQNVLMRDFDYALRMDATNFGFVNSIDISGLTIEGCNYGISIEGRIGRSIGGNRFVNCLIFPRATSQRALYLDYAQSNHFINIAMSDWDDVTAEPVIELTANAHRNFIQFHSEITAVDVSDGGDDNVIRDLNRTYLQENSGARATRTDGSTIAHGLPSTPTVATVSGSVAAEMVTVTSLDAANITVAIKDDAGNAGTSQTVYWRATL